MTSDNEDKARDRNLEKARIKIRCDASGARQGLKRMVDRLSVVMVARLLGRPVTPKQVVDMLDWWIAPNKNGGYTTWPIGPRNS